MSTLAKGPIGFALSSVVWPGTLAGNLGSTIILAGGSERPARGDDAQQPGPRRGAHRWRRRGGRLRRRTRHAHDGQARATTRSPPRRGRAERGRRGRHLRQQPQQHAHRGHRGRARRRGGAPAASATSRIAGGVVTSARCARRATATTDGTTATVDRQHRRPRGMEIAGVPVQITDKGITVQGTNAPLNATLQRPVNAAITAAGHDHRAQPAGGDRSSAAPPTTAPAAWSSSGSRSPDQQFTVVLGGAAVSVQAEPELTFDLGGDVPSTAPGRRPAGRTRRPRPADRAQAAGAGDLGPAVAPEPAAPVPSRSPQPVDGAGRPADRRCPTASRRSASCWAWSEQGWSQPAFAGCPTACCSRPRRPAASSKEGHDRRTEPPADAGGRRRAQRASGTSGWSAGWPGCAAVRPRPATATATC